jgi:hypothetical protein
MSAKRADDDLEAGSLPDGFDADSPRDRDLLDRLSAKLLRLDREAMHLAAVMRQKPKPT